MTWAALFQRTPASTLTRARAGTLLGVVPIAWTIIWTIFFAVAVWIDPAQFSSKFRLVAFPIQLIG